MDLAFFIKHDDFAYAFYVIKCARQFIRGNVVIGYIHGLDPGFDFFAVGCVQKDAGLVYKSGKTAESLRKDD